MISRAILSQAGTRENLAENERSGLNYYSKASHVEEYDVARAEYTNKAQSQLIKAQIAKTAVRALFRKN
jgi:membrane fusion protein (multidrug efflux system)